MKQMRFKWKYLLASILLANNIACSNDDLAQIERSQEQDGSTRTAELVSRTITLETEGTLKDKVLEAMGDSAVSTLQELKLSGPFTSTDMQYVRSSLTGLTVLDLEGVQIKASDVYYKYSNSYWDYTYFKNNELCDYMFRNMDNLEKVVLPSTISAISSYAFYDCGALSDVVMPESLLIINSFAFYNCDSLKSVVLPDNITDICAYAFYDCYSLSSIKFPAGLKNLDNKSFYGCQSLTSVSLPEKLEYLGSEVFRECKKLSSITIPGGVKHIGNHCFYGNDSMAEIILSEGVEMIGNYSFAGCHLVTSVDFPTSLKTISDDAFYSCQGLQKITVPETVTQVGSNFVRDCSNLRAVIWHPNIDVPYCSGVNNCFLFVYTDQIAINDIGNWKNYIINDESESTINVAVNGNQNYANMHEFKAKKLVYDRYFSGETKLGYSSGWQTIVLPFAPDSIYHETKGQIAPFNSGIEGAKPFWLRELTSDGFVDVAKIEANKPYIIAMPNHSEYLEDYCLNGTITFVARDSILHVTPNVLEVSVGPDFEFHPTFNRVNASTEVYALTSVRIYYEDNVYVNYDKSVFVKGQSNVEAFNAYVTTLGGGRSTRTLFDLDTRSKETRAAWIPNKTGIPQIGDM